ncbi:PREDICTED: Fc receptor-like protein 3 isoform X3 [Bison bison bison]|uniref:Fc receptor-like protein 3 isoform X3 n=1 Tax=Bison bison bison TaxID=43346 RepID=A0A6P3HGL8_BISBB|nr:PREDICTED: Fc receptor-like protein 3 isoform X3 [Bison bison bison]
MGNKPSFGETDLPCPQPRQFPMLLWLLLLLILPPGRDQSGVTPKAFLLLNPPWSTNFHKDEVTLTCRDSLSPAQGDIYWYYNENLLNKKSEEIQIHKTGYYKCKTQRSSLSDPVHVDFSFDKLILQAPHSVFEGDEVVLRCQAREEAKEKRFYRNEIQIQSNFTLQSVSMNNDKYHCTALVKGFWTWNKEISKHLTIQVQELFSPPMLIASPSSPTEGSPVTLKCETWLPPQRSHIQLQFCFFREDKALGKCWSSSPELKLPTVWSEDAESYWCQAESVTPSIRKRSLRSQLYVQRIPVSDVTLEIQPPEGQLTEGENLLLICSVAKGTGTITFSWHREGTVRSLGRKTQRSLSAVLQILTVKESDAGRYYCAADNIHGPILSKLIRVTLRIPVSHPLFTFSPAVPQAVEGDVLELRCEAQRGSPPILYWFYYKNVTLGSREAPFGGGASFNLTLMAEHSGNFSCGADNGLGVQHSEMVILSIIGPPSNKTTLITEGVTAGLLSILGLAVTAALVCHFRTQRNSERLSTTGTPSYSPREFKEPSRTSNTNPQEPLDPVEPQPVYNNVNPGDSDLVYSEIWSTQHTNENSANSPRKHWEDKEPTVIYSDLKKAYPDDSTEQASIVDSDLEDAVENYENVPCILSALDR